MPDQRSTSTPQTRATPSAGATDPAGTLSASLARPSRAARMSRVQAVLGLAITIAIAVLHASGALVSAERPLFDLRVRLFDHARAEPDGQVVVVAIDDRTIETVLGWPVPRALLARAVDELRDAGASVIALDILFDTPARQPEDDDQLARALASVAKRSVLAASFPWSGDPTGAGVPAHRDLDRLIELIAARPDISADEIHRQVLGPDAPAAGPDAEDLLRTADRARSMLRARELSSLPVPAGFRAWPPSDDPQPPNAVISQRCGPISSVSFARGDADGTVRRLPLWVQWRDRLFPTMGLAAAALHLGTPIAELRVLADQTVVPAPNARTLRIPMHRAPLKQLETLGPLDGMAYVPWARGGWGGWQDQLAARAPDRSLVPSEVSLGYVLDAQLTLIPAIRENLASLHRAARGPGQALGIIDPAVYEPVAREINHADPRSPEWASARAALEPQWRALQEFAQQQLQGVDPATVTDAERADVELLRSIADGTPRAIEQIDLGLSNLAIHRAELERRVRGRICFVGWVATGAIADFVRTSIDPATPGVVAHAALASAILRSVQHGPQFWRAPPWWIDLAAVLFLGLLGTLAGVRVGVIASPLALLAVLGIAYAFAGAIVWDLGRWAIAQAGPLAAALLSWLAVILHRLLVEQRGRKRTEARFRSYVSPDVVDILVNNPALSSMVPQRRELTIFFSDIAGFTTLAERLGTEGIGQLLGTYLGAMTQVLQEHRATLDKYLGDGIMAFWGAPIDDPHHADNALRATQTMLDTLERMNRDGAFGPAGPLAVRIGLATGEVNVGDFGNPPYKSAYTTIGDAVNLAARLESANKQLGSSVLINQRLRDLAGPGARVRLLGRIIVKGKTAFETLYEPIGTRQPHAERTDEWLALTRDAVNAFIAGDLDNAQARFARLAQDFNEHALASLYGAAIAQLREAWGGTGPPSGWEGTVQLAEK